MEYKLNLVISLQLSKVIITNSFTPFPSDIRNKQLTTQVAKAIYDVNLHRRMNYVF